MSLISGWLPIALQVVALIALLTAIGWRSHRRCALWLPISLLVGVVLAAVGYWYVGYQGWGHDTPFEMWVWITVAGFAAAVSVLGWRGITWWRRVVSILAVPLSLLCAAQALNISIGYLPTVQTAWQRLTDTQPPQWIRQDTLAKLQHDGVRPTRGTLVWVQTPDDVSGFSHRPELVYLPPVWFRTGHRRATAYRFSTTSRSCTTEVHRRWCSPTQAGRSATTPSVSTGHGATPRLTSPKR
jgi:hypothetical protein